jgi:glycosyltransferase involved in cell wall biosynthesis
VSAGDTPLVDVGIPTAGRPDYVREAVESVLNQSLQGWRLVIQEDGPGGGDVQAAVAEYLSDPRVDYRATGEHVGAARNMSKLVQLGSAPYVGLLHDDDLWGPEFLERRVEFLHAHPACGFVFSGHLDIDAGGHLRGRSRLALPEGEHGSEVFVPIVLREDIVDTPTVLVRRSAYESVGAWFDEGIPHLYDWEIWIRLGLASNAGFLATWDASYRWHGAQSSAERHRAWEYLEVFENGCRLVAERAPELSLPPREQTRLRAGYRLSMALDELAAGRRRPALRNGLAALRLRPLAVLDRRTPAVLAGLVLGRGARRAMAALRRLRFRRGARPDAGT